MITPLLGIPDQRIGESKSNFTTNKIGGHPVGISLAMLQHENKTNNYSTCYNQVQYEGCSKSFANRYTENTQSIGI